MIKQKQLFRHNPPETYGDCQRTVYACLLDKHPLSVPHFGVYYDDAKAFNKSIDDWLETQELARVCVVYDGSITVNQVLASVSNINPGMYFLLAGVSRNGTNHVVVGLDHEIYWDPALDDSGIVGPCTDGYYWIEFLVPAFMKA